MITEDFVMYETAKLLKEKGFNEPCLYFYDTERGKRTGERPVENITGVVTNEYLDIRDYVGYLAPTQALTMKWLREKFNLAIDVYVTKGPDWCATVKLFDKFGNTIKQPYNDWTKHYSTYEKACDAAIKYCLENLI